MQLATFEQTLASGSARGYGLDADQTSAVRHGIGPLWMLAGPGSGKSEVLVTRTLKLLCVDSVAARSVFLTTFTRKAAQNLEDRLSVYLTALQSVDPGLLNVDLAELRIGTLHALCNEVLQEYRYPGYQNVRLLDDVEQHLFVYQRADIANHQDVAFWSQFAFAIPRWTGNAGYPPNKWQRARTAVTLFNHIVEDLVDLGSLRAAGGHWATFADFYQQYADALNAYHRCDYAHLQAKFLNFLSAPSGHSFLDGRAGGSPGITQVLVDEYQDTNMIQERIYLALANATTHNLCVVGDDDQALYRFRGGTVACMVSFDQACQASYGATPATVQLACNYRSHNGIVDFFNRYISSFPEMNSPGVRAPGKLPVQANSAIQGNYPAVCWLTARRANDLGVEFVRFLQNHLLADGIISDLSQCALLFRSAKDSVLNAGPFLRALEAANIPVYNPRSKTFLQSEEVQCLLGTLIEVLDQPRSFRHRLQQGREQQALRDDIFSWMNALDAVVIDPNVQTAQLQAYITQSQAELANLISANRGNFLGVGVSEILFRILSCEPFRTWRHDPVREMRIAKVTRLFESFHSMNLGQLVADQNGIELASSFWGRFLHMFLGYLVQAGLSEEEDDEVIVPLGAIPVMTIHQSKGLEFPFVFVGQLGKVGTPGAAQNLEVILQPFRQDLYPRAVRDATQLSLEDDIRLLYVAYSRAQYGLVLMGTQQQMRHHVALPGRDFTSFRRSTPAVP